ncbi:immunity protein YezG family protein [Chitinophaga qingshengii]|uniref:DUF600 domain-containing protein n=1 Tax=Chitinophaga qingshengii TaxID=1569794 RepID=A0ABR7TMV8_9BACT|nr:DUF600 domain-containing protein [Chitinophaga qingshengii]MBC9931821.1 DUF600 domain-containing protein [Chitinophaga qingshengii]
MNNVFDNAFQELTAKMVEIAFEFVHHNSEEVDHIYLYASMEGGCSYNVFYSINGQLVKLHKVNTVLKKPCDISTERMFRLLTQGNSYLKEMTALFQQDNRDVPTLMQLVYAPATGKLDNKISYGLQFTNSRTKTSKDVFDAWFEAVKAES